MRVSPDGHEIALGLNAPPVRLEDRPVAVRAEQTAPSLPPAGGLGPRYAGEPTAQSRDDDDALSRELEALYAISTSFQKEEISMADVARRVVEAVRPVWGRGADCCARVTIRNIEYVSPGFRETPWKRSCEITVRDEAVGVVEVYLCLGDSPDAAGRSAERDSNLLRVLAARLAAMVERCEAQAQKANLEKQLHSTQKLEAVGQLAGGVAHDFGNLLTVILHATERLKRELSPDHHSREALAAIEEAAHQAVSVIHSMLAFSRGEPAVRRAVSLDELVEESTRLLRRVLPASIQLIAQPEPSRLWVLADPTQIKQILLNLVLNARDAMPKGGRVHITVEPAAPADLEGWPDAPAPYTSFVRLTVLDTGCGIPPELQARVFEPFFTTKPRDQGTGLGLSVVHGLVKRNGGRIALESQPDAGTTLRVLLPRARPQTLRALPARKAPASAQRQVFAVAASDPHLGGLLTMTLESLGHEVVRLEGGPPSPEQLAPLRDRIRVLVLDSRSAGAHAADFLALFSDAARRPAVIMIAEPDYPGVAGCPDAEVKILPMPFRTAEFGRLVQEVLTDSR